NVAAERADRLRQRPDLNVHTPVHPEMVDGSAPVPAEDSAGVGIVDHHDAAEFLGDIAQLWQCADVAVHAEDPVRDEQLALRDGQLRDDLSSGGGVLVRKYLDGGPAEPAAVDDACVIELVGDDDIFLG